MDFGFFKGLPYKNSIENFEDYKKYKNSIPKEAILSHISSLDAGLTSLPSFDMFTGEELHAGMFWDGMQAIEAIIRRGNDAEIRRKGDGYIVLEVKKTIKYSTQT